MKKIYAIIAAAMLTATATQARELRFYLDDQQIAEGSEIEYTSITENEKKPGTIDVAIAPPLSLWADLKTTSVKLTVTSLSGHEVQCCAGGSCAIGTSIVKENITINTDQKLDLEFEYLDQYEKGTTYEVPTVKVQLDAVDVNNPTSKASFTIIMGKSAGVATIVRNDDAFRITRNGIAYNVSVPATATLYNLTGKQVLRTAISGQGTIDTANLAEGIYVYTIQGHGVKKSGKIYVF